MNRLAPAVLLVVVTGLFLAYGSSEWSWLAGPAAALVLWLLEVKAREPGAPAPAREATAPNPARKAALVD